MFMTVDSIAKHGLHRECGAKLENVTCSCLDLIIIVLYKVQTKPHPCRQDNHMPLSVLGTFQTKA